VRRTHLVLAALLAAIALVAVGVTSGSARTTQTYMDQHASVNARVADLLRRMTLPEKIGQMDQIVVGKLRDKTNPTNGDCNGDNTTEPQTNRLQTVLIDDKTG
jgi:beta-glucosidase